MLAGFKTFFGNHPILASLMGLTVLDAAYEAWTGAGFVPTSVNPLKPSTFAETLSPGESAVLSLSVGESLELDAPASNPFVSLISSNAAVLTQPTTGTGNKVVTSAPAAGTATLKAQFQDGTTATLTVTVA
jgi:hypothetical protein